MPDQAPATKLHDPADGPVAGATLVIEAPTAEAALTQLHDELGADARIVEVRRIARGGIAGFFARELVELHAAAPAPTGPTGTSVASPTAPPAPGTPSSPPPARSTSGDGTSPIDRLLRADAEAATDEVDFATYLRSQLQPPAAPARPAPAPATHEALLERATAAARMAVRSASGDHYAGGIVDPTTDEVTPAPTAHRSPAPVREAAALPTEPRAEPAPEPTVAREPAAEPVVASQPAAEPTVATEPAPSTEPGPAWSVANLTKLGLPAGLIRVLEVAPPSDDVAWTSALAAALRPACRPLPSGPSLLIGSRISTVAGKLGIPISLAGRSIRSTASTVAVAVRGDEGDRRWIERARGARWLHVVVGGGSWRDLLQLDPLAVSWATRGDLPEAVRLATELGLVLGAGPLQRGVQRARPLDVALAIRELLPLTDELLDGGEQL